MICNGENRLRDCTGWTWLIVGGCPRSGTTLLQLLLNTHPHIRVSNEVSLSRLGQALRAVFAREASFEKATERAKSVRENWTKSTLAPSIPRYAKCAGPMLRAMYEAQFGDQICLADGRYLGDKYPRYYEDDLVALEALIGSIHVLHISRDPIDVVNSMLRRSRNAQLNLDKWKLVRTVEEGCMHWARAWNAIQRRARLQPQHVTHIKYEDLLQDTSNCLAAIARGLQVANAFDGTRVVTDDADDRDIVTPRDIERIDQLLGGLASRWAGAPLERLVSDFPELPVAEPPT